MQAYFEAMRRYSSFSGRSNRAQIWGYSLVSLVIAAAALALDVATGGEVNDVRTNPPVFLSIAILIHALPTAAITARRLHDDDRSGWWTLMTFLPVFGPWIWVFYACATPTPGYNTYGPPVGHRQQDVDPPPTTSDVISSSVDLEKLEKLAALRASGAVDEVEFQAMKSDIMRNRS